MKNKLPEKSTYPPNANAERINQLIDYIAELTEVVEGKQDKKVSPGVRPYTPELRDALLGEVHTKIRKIYDFGTALAHRNDFNDGYNNALKDVEAIINRLMP